MSDDFNPLEIQAELADKWLAGRVVNERVLVVPRGTSGRITFYVQARDMDAGTITLCSRQNGRRPPP